MKTLLHNTSDLSEDMDVFEIAHAGSVLTDALHTLEIEGLTIENALAATNGVIASIEHSGLSKGILAFVGTDFDNLIVEHKKLSELNVTEASEGLAGAVKAGAAKVLHVIKSMVEKVVLFIRKMMNKISTTKETLQKTLPTVAGATYDAKSLEGTYKIPTKASLDAFHKLVSSGNLLDAATGKIKSDWKALEIKMSEDDDKAPKLIWSDDMKEEVTLKSAGWSDTPKGMADLMSSIDRIFRLKASVLKDTEKRLAAGNKALGKFSAMDEVILADAVGNINRNIGIDANYPKTPAYLRGALANTSAIMVKSMFVYVEKYARAALSTHKTLTVKQKADAPKEDGEKKDDGKKDDDK